MNLTQIKGAYLFGSASVLMQGENTNAPQWRCELLWLWRVKSNKSIISSDVQGL